MTHVAFVTVSRWPPKPRAGERCDASLGVRMGDYGEPLIMGCPEQAVETVLMDNGMTIHIYLCAKHVETMTGIIRNPRKRRA